MFVSKCIYDSTIVTIESVLTLRCYHSPADGSLNDDGSFIPWYFLFWVNFYGSSSDKEQCKNVNLCIIAQWKTKKFTVPSISRLFKARQMKLFHFPFIELTYCMQQKSQQCFWLYFTWAFYCLADVTQNINLNFLNVYFATFRVGEWMTFFSKCLCNVIYSAWSQNKKSSLKRSKIFWLEKYCFDWHLGTKNKWFGVCMHLLIP